MWAGNKNFKFQYIVGNEKSNSMIKAGNKNTKFRSAKW